MPRWDRELAFLDHVRPIFHVSQKMLLVAPQTLDVLAVGPGAKMLNIFSQDQVSEIPATQIWWVQGPSNPTHDISPLHCNFLSGTAIPIRRKQAADACL